MTKSVAEFCREQSIGFDALVEKSGLLPDRVAAIVAGRWTPSPEERQKIASALNVTPDEVTWGHTTPIQHIYGHGPG
ncbi:MAG: XRE family transcriptional regulator [Planctomycetota bacterium]|nr:MAG: XRE family transcriptional regulator [Planctomycetota bacterium]REJ95196.1 MAG: XRE family transcriptional regulator [Planctomycetota bacterium]REK25041.1 MAG: XRE family transcriptional regulator [Planctomycetota bacterium]REK28105.1 MAG: XRE family transcriptional regulator [Planctomycetota bacterium]